MIEEQVEIESLPVNLERDLAANESESPTQLQKEVAEMDQQTALQFALFGAFGQGQKIKVVGVLQNLHGQIGAFRRQRLGEVCECLSLPLMQSA